MLKMAPRPPNPDGAPSPDDDRKLSLNEVENVTSKPPYDSTAAELGTQAETSLTVRQAFRYYWKAVFWSVSISMATIMESYAIQLINSFFAFPQFNQKYGQHIGGDQWSIPARWQLALNLVTFAGLIIGVFGNGYAAERFGPRKTMMASLIVLTPLIAMTLAPNLGVLLASQALW